jgi:cbb3-type cytochrome oxidase maturation protein
MSVMYILILASLTVAVGFLLAFLWAVRSGQFEDKYTPKLRMLFDEKKNSFVKEISQDKTKES